MNIALNKVLLIIALAAVAVAIPFTVMEVQKRQNQRSKASGQPVALSVSPASGTYAPGAQFVVDLLLNNSGYDITAVDISVSFDNTLLELVSFQPASTFNSEFLNQPNIPNGPIRFSSGNTSFPKIDQALIPIATLSFKAKGEGTATITFQTVQVTASGNANALPLGNHTNGSFTIAVPSTPTPTVPTPTPTIVVIPPNAVTKTYAFSSGWNLISIPLELSVPIPASTFLYSIGPSPTNPNTNRCVEIYDNIQNAQSSPRGAQASVITGGKAYFVFCNEPSAAPLELHGLPFNTPPSFTTSPGTQLITVPYGYDKKASDFFADFTPPDNCQVLDRWISNISSWRGFPKPFSVTHSNNFQISDTEGYGLECR